MTVEPVEGTDQLLIRGSVADSGIGIDEATRNKLFDRFTQGDASTTRRYGGTGLGLAICRQLCELMQGRIWVDSVLDEGTTFQFELRMRQVAGARDMPEVETGSLLAGKRALVVDTNATQRRILERQLSCFGMDIQSSDSGRKAIGLLDREAAQGKPVDIAVIDHAISDVDVELLVGRIRDLGRFSDLKILLLRPGEPALARKLSALQGVDGWENKPIHQSALRRGISRLLVPHESGGEASSEPQKRSALPRAARSLRVLVVEDNKINQMLATRLLERVGHRVQVAGNGLEGISAVRSRPFDLVLMDMQMPEMDGLEATQKIRDLPDPLCRLPIIAMTANALQGDRERCLAAGMNDYVSKPIDVSELIDKVARWSEPDPVADSVAGSSSGLPSVPEAEAHQDQTTTAKETDLMTQQEDALVDFLGVDR